MVDVPYIDLGAAYRDVRAEIDKAVADVLAGGVYVLGENVEAFEDEFGAWLGGVEVAGVNSGTDALYLTLKALGIGPGDEVITVSHTAVNTALAISKAGASPVFVDIDEDSYCMDPEGLAEGFTSRTRAIVPVHLYGYPADMDPIMDFANREGLAVIEDCAQAHGATCKDRKVGTIGTAGCFSFYPTKNLGACGDGGAVASGDKELIDKVRSLSNCGQGEQRYLNLYKGDVSRLDEIQAAVLRVKLKRLDEYTRLRRQVAEEYSEGLATAELRLPRECEGSRHVFHQYVVRSPRRDALQEFLSVNGIRALIHYPLPAHQQPAYNGVSEARLPVTEMVVKEILSLPVYPELQQLQIEHVVQLCSDFQAGE